MQGSHVRVRVGDGLYEGRHGAGNLAAQGRHGLSPQFYAIRVDLNGVS